MMRHRHSLVPILILVALSLVATVSQAAKPVVQSTPLQGTILNKVVGTPNSVHTQCLLGVTGDPAWIINGWLLPPDDSYYTLLRPADCACPGPRGVLLSVAHVLLSFSEVCSVPVTVGVVAATGTPGCLAPIPGQYLCPPVSYNLSVTATGIYDFSMPLSEGCCITDNAFLVITFDGEGTCGTLPDVITTDGCETCVSYNGWPPSSLHDLCVDYNFPGNLNMYVEAACCDVVPAIPGTWGRIKMLYR